MKGPWHPNFSSAPFANALHAVLTSRPAPDSLDFLKVCLGRFRRQCLFRFQDGFAEYLSNVHNALQGTEEIVFLSSGTLSSSLRQA